MDLDDVAVFVRVIDCGGFTKAATQLGEYLKYYPTGQLKEKATMLNGDYDGELNYIDEKGTILKTEFYKNGKLQRTK